MKEQDKREIRQIFNEGFEQLILPHFESIDKRFESIEGGLGDLRNDVGRIEQKLDAEISWRDDASKRIKKVEVKLGFVK